MFGIFLGIVLVALAAGSIALIGWMSFQRTVDLSEAFGIRGRPVNILLLGVDRTYDREGHAMNGGSRADTIMVASLNPDKKSTYLISIPRDTRAEIPGYGTGKINSAHARGGPELVMRSVERLLGMPVDGYVETDFEGFARLIDLLGGVTVEVDRDMRYVDRAGKFEVNLKAGVQKLDGEHALQFVRFRHDALGDIARVGRQQQLLKAILTSAVAPRNIAKAKELLQAALDCVKTDLNLRQAGACGWFLTHITGDRVETITLPGEFAPLYWMPDRQEIDDLVKMIQGETRG